MNAKSKWQSRFQIFTSALFISTMLFSSGSSAISLEDAPVLTISEYKNTKAYKKLINDYCLLTISYTIDLPIRCKVNPDDYARKIMEDDDSYFFSLIYEEAIEKIVDTCFEDYSNKTKRYNCLLAMLARDQIAIAEYNEIYDYGKPILFHEAQPENGQDSKIDMLKVIENSIRTTIEDMPQLHKEEMLSEEQDNKSFIEMLDMMSEGSSKETKERAIAELGTWKPTPLVINSETIKKYARPKVDKVISANSNKVITQIIHESDKQKRLRLTCYLNVFTEESLLEHFSSMAMLFIESSENCHNLELWDLRKKEETQN